MVKLYFLHVGQKCSSKHDVVCSGKVWHWMMPTHRMRYITSHNEIKLLAEKKKEPFMTCQRRILNFTGASHRAIYGYSDIYYIPAAKVVDFITIASVFFRHGAFLEVAVASTLFCISNGTKQMMLPGIAQADFKKRSLPWVNIDNLYNNRTLVFYHATKWKNVLHNYSRYLKLFQDTFSSLHKCSK